MHRLLPLDTLLPKVNNCCQKFCQIGIHMIEMLYQSINFWYKPVIIFIGDNLISHYD